MEGAATTEKSTSQCCDSGRKGLSISTLKRDGKSELQGVGVSGHGRGCRRTTGSDPHAFVPEWKGVV